jgi:hypothetical protein
MPFTRLLMSLAAVVVGAVGFACLYMPDDVLEWIAGAAPPGPTLITQVLGTLSLGLAALDWMWRGNRIGGIYGRPVAIANVMHFVSAALVMATALKRYPELRALWPLAAIYAVLGVGFLALLFRDPGAALPAPRVSCR